MSRPDPLRTLGEMTAGWSAVRLAASTPRLVSAPRGNGAPVILVTGFGGDDRSLTPMRRWLRGLGHDARRSRLGRMTGDVEGQTGALCERIVDVTSRTGRPPAVIGWSIGGIVAREAARELPGAVRRVVTFGSPVEGGPRHTVFGDGYSVAELDEIAAAIASRRDRPLSVPVTAIWSRNDGIVHPDACIDRHEPAVEHVEVGCTHIGMGIDPAVWLIVADRLGRPAPVGAR